MSKYIDADKLYKQVDSLMARYAEYEKKFEVDDEELSIFYQGKRKMCSELLGIIDSLQQEQDRMRYCIEYINPQYPLLDNGGLNIRHLRVPDEHGAEMVLTLMLSLGAKIYALYRGNVKEGKLAEWPTPMIVDPDDWYSFDWLHDILDCGHSL